MAGGPSALPPQCYQHAASEHGSTLVYSGNAAAVVGVVICVVLLFWWMHEYMKEG